jgi:hypothetical protein
MLHYAVVMLSSVSPRPHIICTHLPLSVVSGALLWVRQDLICLLHTLEVLRSIGLQQAGKPRAAAGQPPVQQDKNSIMVTYASAKTPNAGQLPWKLPESWTISCMATNTNRPGAYRAVDVGVQLQGKLPEG